MAAMQHEFSLAFEAFKASNARVESLKLEVLELTHRIEQLESAQFEIEQTIADGTLTADGDAGLWLPRKS